VKKIEQDVLGIAVENLNMLSTSTSTKKLVFTPLPEDFSS
jgi:hypothetical protein